VKHREFQTGHKRTQTKLVESRSLWQEPTQRACFLQERPLLVSNFHAGFRATAEDGMFFYPTVRKI
jgi:hypothetical protein